VSMYKLYAQSIIHPGNFLVKHSNGACYIFFADIGELSVTAIDESLAKAMGQSYEWQTIDSSEEVTLADLQARAASGFPPVSEAPDVSQPEN
jgi:hypothetical protein